MFVIPGNLARGGELRREFHWQQKLWVPHSSRFLA
jgi:hypothetical protein